MLPSKQKHSFKKRQPYIFFHHLNSFRGIYNVADITEKKVLENEVKNSNWDFSKNTIDSSPMQTPS